MRARVLVAIAGVLAVVVVLVATLLLSGGKPRPTPDTYFQAIKSRGVLRVGIDPTYSPFDTLQDGSVSGYDAALATEIASSLGVRVQFVPMALDTLYDGLAAGKVDILVSALPFIYQRQKDVRYSEPYFQAGQMLIVKAGDKSITAPTDLKSKRVAVELGSEADTEARRLARTSVPGMNVISQYDSPQAAMSAVQRGDTDAAITDNLSAEEYARAHPGSIKILLPPLTDEPYVVVMPVKADQLAGAINSTIESLRSSGKLAEIMSK